MNATDPTLPLKLLTAPSRQQRYRLRKQAAGACTLCGNPERHPQSTGLCETCLNVRRAAARERIDYQGLVTRPSFDREDE